VGGFEKIKGRSAIHYEPASWPHVPGRKKGGERGKLIQAWPGSPQQGRKERKVESVFITRLLPLSLFGDEGGRRGRQEEGGNRGGFHQVVGPGRSVTAGGCIQKRGKKAFWPVLTMERGGGKGGGKGRKLSAYMSTKVTSSLVLPVLTRKGKGRREGGSTAVFLTEGGDYCCQSIHTKIRFWKISFS